MVHTHRNTAGVKISLAWLRRHKAVGGIGLGVVVLTAVDVFGGKRLAEEFTGY